MPVSLAAMGVNSIIILGIAIFIIFYLIYVIMNLDKQYVLIDNDNDTGQANSYISYAQWKINKTPMDNYRIGTLYDYVLKDNNRARQYYTQSLKQIHSAPVDQQGLFIRNRLRDRITRVAEEDENVFDFHNLTLLEDEINRLENGKTFKLKGGTLEENIQWTEDTQNVHDSNITDELGQQFREIKQNNISENAYIWEYDDIMQYLNNAKLDYKENVSDAIKMLDIIKKNDTTDSSLGAPQREVVRQVFSNIMQKPEEKQKVLLENLALNLKDSYKDGNPVCIRGQSSRILSSFAGEDNIGILKSEQVIKNEILGKSANIRNKILDAAPEDIRTQYNNSQTSQEVKKLDNNIKTSIETMIRTDYPELKESKKQELITEIKEYT